MENLPLISKLIGSSLLALSLLAMTYLSFSATQSLFGKKIISYVVSTLTLLILVFISLIILTRQLNNSQTIHTGLFARERIVSELTISVLMVVSFLGTQIIINWVRSVSLARISPLKLASVPSVLSLNQMLVQWDDEQVSYERVLGEQILRSLTKSIKQQDKTGWLELEELTRESWATPAGQQALVLIIRELWGLEKLSRAKTLSNDIGECEEKLKSLLPHFAITPINELIGELENGDVSDEEVKDAMLLGSFKKLITCEDETGFYELKEKLFDEKLKVQQIAETELWYLKRGVNSRPSLENDIEEKKLNSLLAFA